MILALKLVLTPALIAGATLVGRRFGPSISGWLVGLPFTSGPVSLFLALEQGTSFAAGAAAGSIGGVAASAVFAIAYAAMARRFAWQASLAVASLAFAAAVIALRALPLDSGLPLPLLALYAGGVAAAILGIRLIPPPRALDEAPLPPRWDLPVRMAVATALVIVITSAAPLLGPQLSGLLTTYPVYHRVRDVLPRDRRARRPSGHRGGFRLSRRGCGSRSSADADARQERVAFTDNLTLPLRAREIGQFSFASSAA